MDIGVRLDEQSSNIVWLLVCFALYSQQTVEVSGPELPLWGLLSVELMATMNSGSVQSQEASMDNSVFLLYADQFWGLQLSYDVHSLAKDTYQ